MHCRYCGHSNREGDLRCARCDGRLRPPVLSGRSSAVPVEHAHETQAVPAPPPTAERRPSGPPRQAALFDPGNVIKFPGPATRAMRALKGKPAAAAKDARHSTHSGAVLSGTQVWLPGMDLLPHQTQSVPVQRSDWPVAAPVVRLKAALLDATVVLCGVLASLVPFWLAGGRVAMAPKAMLGFGAYAVVLSLFYQVFWCVLRRPSFGEAAKRLRLVTFEGETPNSSTMGLRLAALVLTSLAAGLGPLWALLDEERLAWHDHMSKTYPTRA